MFKSTFMALMALLLCLSAQAGTYIRTHEDFVHLSDYEKNQMIIKTMELVVALESQYNYEVKKYGYNSERFEKFMKAVSKVKSILFIDSAYAAPAPTKKPMTDWNSYGNAFKTLMSKSGSNCFFAGWPSKPYVLPGTNKTYCGHPDFLQGDGPNRHRDKPMSEWTQYYPDPVNSDCGINDRKKIQCNPAIFGFKKASSGSLFCVTASDGAHNSAYNCMQEALKERPADGTIDTPEARLGQLRTALGSNPGAFAAVQNFVYKTCVCDSTPANFNKDYQTYVRKHRTCYGMMEMIGKVSCGSTLPIDTSIFTSLQEYANNKISYNSATNTAENLVDHHYEQFIQNEVKVKARTEYNRLCGANVPEVIVPPVTKDYECSKATCQTTVNGTTTSYACSTFAIKVKGTEEVVTMDANPTEVPKAAADTSLEIKGSIAGVAVTLQCPLEIKPVDAVPVTYACSAATCKTIAPAEAGGKPTFECSYTVHETGKPDAPASFTIDAGSGLPAEGAVPGTSLRLPIKGKVGEQVVEAECPMTLTAVTPEVVETAKTYECSKAECSATAVASTTPTAGIAGVEATAGAPAFTCSLEANEKDKTEKISFSGKSPEGTPENNKTSVFKVEIGGKQESLSCKVTMKVAPVPEKIEPKPAPKYNGAAAPATQGPPRTQMRGSSDTSAVGIK